VAYDVTPTPMPMPLAYSGPHQLSGERTPELVEHQTSVRMPLSWPGATRQPEPPRRKPWIILGVAAGTIGIALGAFLALRGAPADTKIAMTPTVVPIAPITPTVVPTAPAPTAVTPPAEPAPAPSPAPTEPAVAAAPEPTKPKPPVVGPAKTVQRTPRVIADPVHKIPDVKPAKPDPAPTAIAAPPVPAPAAPPTKPAKKVSHAGISSNDLSGLWASVGNELMHGAGTRLPSDQRDELKRQYTLMKIQQLMGAPQADRDAAAAVLQNIADQMAGH
jgi:hypothetical protein